MDSCCKSHFSECLSLLSNRKNAVYVSQSRVGTMVTFFIRSTSSPFKKLLTRNWAAPSASRCCARGRGGPSLGSQLLEHLEAPNFEGVFIGSFVGLPQKLESLGQSGPILGPRKYPKSPKLAAG